MSDFETVTVTDVPGGRQPSWTSARTTSGWPATPRAPCTFPWTSCPARLDELDPDEDLYVICRTGGRSFRAAQWLVGQGYSAMNVAGGMDQWLETGKPLVSDNGLKPVVSDLCRRRSDALPVPPHAEGILDARVPPPPTPSSGPRAPSPRRR